MQKIEKKETKKIEKRFQLPIVENRFFINKTEIKHYGKYKKLNSIIAYEEVCDVNYRLRASVVLVGAYVGQSPSARRPQCD